MAEKRPITSTDWSLVWSPQTEEAVLCRDGKVVEHVAPWLHALWNGSRVGREDLRIGRYDGVREWGRDGTMNVRLVRLAEDAEDDTEVEIFESRHTAKDISDSIFETGTFMSLYSFQRMTLISRPKRKEAVSDA